MNSVLKRIKEIARSEGISITALEASIGASKGVFSRALANGTDIQSKWLVSLVENYPQYSPEWLLSGKGDIRKEPSVARETAEYYQKTVPQPMSNPVADALQQVIAAQEKVINTLEKHIDNLEKEIQALKK